MDVESQLFENWSSRFYAFVQEKDPELIGTFKIGANQNADGELQYYLDAVSEDYIGTDKSQRLDALWTEFCRSNPF